MTVEEAEKAFRDRMQKDTPPYRSLYYEMDPDIRRWQEDRAILREERERGKAYYRASWKEMEYVGSATWINE